MKKPQPVAAIVGLLGAIALVVSAGAFADLGKVEIGSTMPNFKLTDYNGKEHQLSDYAGKIVVIDFLSKDCPWSRGAAPGIAGLAREYDGLDVVFIGINSNDGATRDGMATYAESASISYVIALDPENKYADTVGATRTPEIFVVDREGELAYHGAYDNRTSPEQTGDVNYTKNAVDALLEGKSVAKPEVSAWGCTIKRAAKKPS